MLMKFVVKKSKNVPGIPKKSTCRNVVVLKEVVSMMSFLVSNSLSPAETGQLVTLGRYFRTAV